MPAQLPGVDAPDTDALDRRRRLPSGPAQPRALLRRAIHAWFGAHQVLDDVTPRRCRPARSPR